MERLEADLQKALLPRDPNDERNIFSRSAPAPAVDESALFAPTCSACTRAYAERQGWQAEVISESLSELGATRK